MDSTGLSARLGAVELPLAPRLGEICAALDRAGALVLRADPGSGKSTLTPLALMAAQPAAGGGPDILMLEPRRAAVLGIAGRMAELLGERVGERAGYAVRMERRMSGRTRIEVLTEGLLVRRLQRDPQLPAVRTVIFDEFHERSLHSDLALALVLDLRRMGSPLRILVMSATMDAAAVARHITALDPLGPEVPVIDCPGRAYPVTIRHRPLPRREGLGRDCAAVIESFLDSEYQAGGGAETRVTPPSSPPSGGSGSRAAPPGCEAAVASSPPPPPMVPAGGGAAGEDMLVFLPGRREIEEARLALRNAGFGSRPGPSPVPQDPAAQNYRQGFEVLVLYGGLPLDRQREIIAPRPTGPRKRRIILSTNVAETGLTIPGITVVVDSGFARIAGFHLPSGMNRLQLEPISRASAEQRAGRAGRLGPGLCLRLWHEGDLRPDETGPEIRRSDLASLVLECFLWGVRDRLALPWLEAPPQAAWDRGRELLVDLGALDREGRPTEKGRTMARLGLDCRLAALCAGAGEQEALGCAAAAVLSDRDAPGLGEDADFRERLSLLRRGLAGTARSELSTEGRDAWVRRTAELGADLLRRLGGGDRPLVWSLEEEAAVGELLAGAFPDRIGRRQEAPQESRRGGIQGVYRFSSGRDALLTGPLAACEWIVAAEIDAGERAGSVRLAAPLSPQGALDALGSRITARYLIRWKEPLRELAPRGVLVKRAGGIPISEERGNPPREAILPALATLLTGEGIDLLPWEAGARRLLDRIRFLAARPAAGLAEGPVPLEPGSWTDGALIADLGLWLGPFIREGESPVIGGGDLREALAARLGWNRMEALERLVPDQFRPPAYRGRAAGPPVPPRAGGSNQNRRPGPPRPVPIDYGGGEPVVRLRLQDALGITGPCEILGVPLVFHLLSPAGRPIQITRDLPGFWKGSYAEVRKEMRGRYPKHDWPEL